MDIFAGVFAQMRRVKYHAFCLRNSRVRECGVGVGAYTVDLAIVHEEDVARLLADG